VWGENCAGYAPWARDLSNFRQNVENQQNARNAAEPQDPAAKLPPQTVFSASQLAQNTQRAALHPLLPLCAFETQAPEEPERAAGNATCTEHQLVEHHPRLGVILIIFFVGRKTHTASYSVASALRQPLCVQK